MTLSTGLNICMYTWNEMRRVEIHTNFLLERPRNGLILIYFQRKCQCCKHCRVTPCKCRVPNLHNDEMLIFCWWQQFFHIPHTSHGHVAFHHQYLRRRRDSFFLSWKFVTCEVHSVNPFSGCGFVFNYIR